VLGCDFLTAETVFLRTLYVLFFIEVATRRVRVVGVTRNPDSAWITQQARNVAVTGALEDKHVLIRDRDSEFSGPFDEVFRTEGARVIKTPVRAPRRMLSRSGGWVQPVGSASTTCWCSADDISIVSCSPTPSTTTGRGRTGHLSFTRPIPATTASQRLGPGSSGRRDVPAGPIHEYERSAAPSFGPRQALGASV
jgi:putative transposase